ncbi:Sec7 domain containing protein [Trichomonas vaginalis G3]|uniref:Sec7 domain containing protein n=1 Tax=Trichomonas vaginalis (strain ATCC PRA-98 / G3) TaxID=412133 RepID=A2DVT4_TRIV3|nr:guanyl-nucleotide exchange factor family [Trichomonas vaginalis G3]EAY15497.1 Sec7 domain containing protein [Trichomonas vaginalis G3]KAI5511508.1 guanyl-nucleotide exchange factor family [Trichomonas vaginalis G3]|eukprot:XP_001327720.1 Sec7 domain containing protein [Trichomonas vaginalis G3]
MEAFYDEYLKILGAIRYTAGSIWYRDLKRQITEVEQYIQSKPQNFDLKKALVPIWTAMDQNPVFQNIVLEGLTTVCKLQKIPALVFLKIIDVLNKIQPNPQDGSIPKMCELALALYRNHNAQYTLHGLYLRNFFGVFFKIFSIIEQPDLLAGVRDVIKEITNNLFQSYGQPVPIKRSANMSTYAKNIVYTLSQNSAHIRKFLRPVITTGDYSVTIYDCDLYVLLSLIAKCIEARVNINSSRYSLVVLLYAFDVHGNNAFFKSTTFKYLLQNQLHVAFLSMFLKGQIEHQFSTVSILKTVWSKFADFYQDGLYEILTKGLATTMKSPDPEIVAHALKVYHEMSTLPQFFVDIFVNYDCDCNGIYTNAFQDCFEKIVSLSYPDMPVRQDQLDALEIVVEILQSMWTYFSNFEVSTENVEAPQDFLEAKKTKAKLDIGLEIFKKSSKKGVAFFIQEGFTNDDPASIAKFFHNTHSLNPTSVGEYLGTKDNIEVLKEYVEIFNFKGMSFEQAFRMFLQSFTIPGEAQMIDRFMEQFGTKYYNDNPGTFSCADTCYMLAFSALMLNTDSHNKAIKNHMTFPQFVANNRNLDNGKDLHEDFLRELYNGITSKEICVLPNSVPSLSLLTLEQRSELYNMQCAQMIEDAKDKSRITDHSFHHSESPLFIGPMFQSIWGGALGALTMTLQQSDDPSVYNLCLKGLTLAVHIASHCFVENALDTLVDSFSKFTNLRKNLSEVQPKNIQCTNALLRIAIEDKNFLRGAWEIVLAEISALDRKKDDLSSADTTLIDELFMATDTLDRESIADFLKSLVSVSKSELSEKEPRKFSLQQLAVVAHFNMKRPRFIWVAIWGTIGEHLSSVGTSDNENMADITIDILRQLAIKFMNEEELSQFHFQEHFMKPFQYIFERQKLQGPKRLVIDCITMLARELGLKLKSGWATVISIVASASKESKDVSEPALDLLKFIINESLSSVVDYNVSLNNAINAYESALTKEVADEYRSKVNSAVQSKKEKNKK